MPGLLFGAHHLEYREEAVSETPARIRTTVPLDEDELRLTFDEGMSVVDPSR